MFNQNIVKLQPKPKCKQTLSKRLQQFKVDNPNFNERKKNFKIYENVKHQNCSKLSKKIQTQNSKPIDRSSRQKNYNAKLFMI